MRDLVLREAGMRIVFRIRDDKTVELTDFSADDRDCPDEPDAPDGAEEYRAHQLIALQVTGRSSLNGTHGGKHIGGSDSLSLTYVSHELIWEETDGRSPHRHLILHLRSSETPLEADYHMLLYPGIAMVRVWTQLRNIGEEPIGIDYVSSFVYAGLGHQRTLRGDSTGDSGKGAARDGNLPKAERSAAGACEGATRDEALPKAERNSAEVNANAGSDSLQIAKQCNATGNNACAGSGSRPYERLRVCVPTNSWDSEAQWREYPISELGVSRMPMDGFALPDMGTDRFSYGSIGSWSTGRHLPIALVRDPATGTLWYGQIEHSGSWRIEYGSCWGRGVYVMLLGPDNESEWWKELAPGETFTTVPAGFGVCRASDARDRNSSGDAAFPVSRPTVPASGSGASEIPEFAASTFVSAEADSELTSAAPGPSVSSAFAQMTRYRRAIRERSADDGGRTVVFNDYMNCLFGDPTEERELPMIDLAAQLGAECYCIDAGWYDDGPWWDRIGEWEEAPGRFPNGLKKVIDYIRQKGMRAGLWIEIEAMGTACALSQKLPDDWFICRHGRRRVDSARYLLDFRNPDVRAYCTGVIDRLIVDYGVSYFKIDYNVTTGAGSDLYADSPGDALIGHVRCLYDWIREQYMRHPGLIIENCGSGAQRMDYGILSLHSLQSTSDNTDYETGALIASNIATAVTPEQAGQWVYPYRDEREHVIACMVSGLLLRPYLSGNIWAMSPENLALMKEGVDLYKKLRTELPDMVPYWPLGLHSIRSEVLAFAMVGTDSGGRIISGENNVLAGCVIPGENSDSPGTAADGRVISVGNSDSDASAAGDKGKNNDSSGRDVSALPDPSPYAPHAYLAVFFLRQTQVRIPLAGMLGGWPENSVQRSASETGCAGRTDAEADISERIGMNPGGARRTGAYADRRCRKITAGVIYPAGEDCTFRIEGDALITEVDAAGRDAVRARLFEIKGAADGV